MATKPRNGKFLKVKDNLYRYSTSKVYYAVFRRQGKLRWTSLKTTDKEIAHRKLREMLAQAGLIDPVNENLTLTELLDMFGEQIARYDTRTQANRRSIIKAFLESWKHGFDLHVRKITAAQIDTWLAAHQSRMNRSSVNAYIIFLRQLFALAVSARAIAVSPASQLKMLKPERAIKNTPNTEEFQHIVQSIRSQRFSDDAEHTADLVEFMGLAGVGTAECANLKGEHIDFANGRISLYRKKTDVGYTIPIFPQARPLLDRFLVEGKIKTGEPVFKIRDPLCPKTRTRAMLCDSGV